MSKESSDKPPNMQKTGSSTSTSRINPESILSEKAKEKVLSVGNAVKDSSQIDDYERLEDIRNRSQKLKIILKTWDTQQTEERNLRKTYAKWLLFALFLQIILINAAFFLIGFGLMAVEKWVATTFIIAVFFEISALLLVVVNYLFPKVGSDLIKLLEKI